MSVLIAIGVVVVDRMVLHLDPVVLVLRHHLMVVPGLSGVEVRARVHVNRLRVLAMVLRMQVQVSDLLVVLVPVALFFMIVHELVHQLLVGLMVHALTVDPSCDVVRRVSHILNEVLNVVLALVEESVPDSLLLDLLLGKLTMPGYGVRVITVVIH